MAPLAELHRLDPGLHTDVMCGLPIELDAGHPAFFAAPRERPAVRIAESQRLPPGHVHFHAAVLAAPSLAGGRDMDEVGIAGE